jgi:hypothetical protein
MDRVNIERSNTPLALTSVYSRVVGSKSYELTDHTSTTLSIHLGNVRAVSTTLSIHLGNVRAVVGDIKIPTGTNNMFTADLRSAPTTIPIE